jgi:cation transport regulator
MPYQSKTELPAAVRKLPEHAQTIWMAAFNSAHRQYKDEQKAFAVAWAAANKHKKVNESGRARRDWHPPDVLRQLFTLNS